MLRNPVEIGVRGGVPHMMVDVTMTSLHVTSSLHVLKIVPRHRGLVSDRQVVRLWGPHLLTRSSWKSSRCCASASASAGGGGKIGTAVEGLGFSAPLRLPLALPLPVRVFKRAMESVREFWGKLLISASGEDCASFCAQSSSLSPKKGIFSAGWLCTCAWVSPGLASPGSNLGAAVGAAVGALPAMDFVAAAITLVGALGILQVFDELAKRDVLEKKLSRKLVHILSGLVFMLFWPLFSSSPIAKYMAAFAPAANGIRMIGLGLGLWTNEALVKACSREGGRRELLQGPLYYAITITIVTLFFWRNSPVGVVAVANLCAGDGFADIVGRKYGTQMLPYNKSKSVIGSIAFFVMASLASMGYVAYFSAFGFFPATANIYLATIGVSLASAIAESLPLPLDDNFTVPFVAIAAGMLLLPF